MHKTLPEIPMCWKCCYAITEEEDCGGFTSYRLIGCKECRHIKDYASAKEMCPILFGGKEKDQG